MVITTRNATLFEGRFTRLDLDVFDTAEAHQYLTNRLAAMQRPVERGDTAALVAEVGLLPQRLALAASYLQKYPIVTTVAYVSRLRALRHESGT